MPATAALTLVKRVFVWKWVFSRDLRPGLSGLPPSRCVLPSGFLQAFSRPRSDKKKIMFSGGMGVCLGVGTWKPGLLTWGVWLFCTWQIESPAHVPGRDVFTTRETPPDHRHFFQFFLVCFWLFAKTFFLFVLVTVETQKHAVSWSGERKSTKKSQVFVCFWETC